MRSSEHFAAAPAEAEELEFGEIVGVFGVQGEVRLHLHHRDSSLLAKGLEVVLVDPDGGRWLSTLRTREGAGRRVLGRLGSPLSREDAAALKGWRVRVRVADLPPLQPGEFWVWQVLGAEVLVEQERVGTVCEVHSTGPVEVFEVRPSGGGDSVFVPALTEHVGHVEAGRVVLTPEGWPDGEGS